MDIDKVVAVVVTYNRKELLCECLQALLGQSVPLAKVIVVNNASTDGTLDKLNDAGFASNTRVYILTLQKNSGDRKSVV